MFTEGHAGEALRLFVIDDSAAIRRKIGSLLFEMKNVEIVGESGRPDGAIEALKRLKPDVVTLDIRMPSGSGIDLIAPIKQALAGVVIIMLTNFPYHRYRQICGERGADYFLDKSTELPRLAQILETLGQAPDRPARPSSGGQVKIRP